MSWLCSASLSAAPDGEQHALYQSLDHAERSMVDQVLEELGLSLDSAPEGKLFGQLYVVNLEVFRDDTRILMWANSFHTVTRPEVVQREILWHESDLFDAELVWETLRNLRRRNTLSVVAIVAVESQNPAESVDLLVVTRDTWSLRLGVNLAYTHDTMTRLSIALTEWNLLGMHTLVSLGTILKQDTYEIGPTLVEPRLFGSRLYLVVRLALVLNRESHEIEGTQGEFQLGLPLFSRHTRWGFSISEAHDTRVQRSFIGPSLRTWDNPETPEAESVPFEIDAREIELLAEGHYSLGTLHKQVLSLGWGLSSRAYQHLDQSLDPDLRQAFEAAILPNSEFASFLALSLNAFRSTHTTVSNFGTYGFSEDLRTGYEVRARLLLSSLAIGSDNDFIQPDIRLGYNAVLEELILLAAVEAGLRWDLSAERLYDNHLTARVHLATPYFGPLRVHLAGRALKRFNRFNAQLLTLGGESGLRGYQAGRFLAESFAIGHLEIRTLPLYWLTTYVGFLFFVDVGSAFDEGESPPLYSNIGLGLRVVIPQLQRTPLRLDYAFPTSPPHTFLPGVLTFGFDHVF